MEIHNLNGKHKLLIMIMRAAHIDNESQAVILGMINEEEMDQLIQWSINLYDDNEKVATEQDFMQKLSEILPTTR